jgi:UDP-N-acetyl-D-mannosaminuronic acid dehydrogenase
VLPGRILVELIDNDRCIGGITPRCARKALPSTAASCAAPASPPRARGGNDQADRKRLPRRQHRLRQRAERVADKMDVDVWEVIRLANRHPRVNILSPGPGVGGHCIAVDPWFLVHARPNQHPADPHRAAGERCKVEHTIRTAEALIESLPGAQVACLGLAFKANIDDFRESPALKVAAHVAARFGSRVNIVEPYADALPNAFDGTGATLTDIDTALESCAILIVLVDHDVFKSVPVDERADKLVYDTRGIWPDQPKVAPAGEGLRKVS